ncbi:cell surface A33 antigen [Mustela putorius furo]|uniref:Cell surface A33 antigen n=1 Tax=Mustela putorius furo TaxID=9669 RepID=M3YW62_MUSPF|nr:cell surface A33 antigen [Mustela putorius furo]
MVGKLQPVLWTLCAVWVAVRAISVETPQEIVRAARGKSVTLPCTYRTPVSKRNGFIQWDKLLRTHSESVLIWEFSRKGYIYGDRYMNRANISSGAEHSDASLTISQLTMDDNGTYECSVSLIEDLAGTSRSRVRLLVLVAPSKPDCAIEGETVIGNNIQLTCQSKEGSPAPQYSWKSYDILNKERPAPAVAGQILSLKNISTDMSGYYICTSSNEVGTEFCNITVAIRLPSMNVALYAGIAGGLAAAFIVLGIVIYCCCCRGKDEAEDTKPNRMIYQKPPEQVRELQTEREEDDNYGQEDRKSTGRGSPGHADR